MKGTIMMISDAEHISVIMYNICRSKCPNGIDYSLDRPSLLLFRKHHTENHSFERIKIDNLHGRTLSSNSIQILTDPTITKICWDKEITTTISNTLLLEAGCDLRCASFVDLSDLLKEHGYPHHTLGAASKFFTKRQCPKANTKDLSKLRTRFNILSKIVSNIMYIEKNNLIDGILY